VGVKKGGRKAQRASFVGWGKHVPTAGDQRKHARSDQIGEEAKKKRQLCNKKGY